jgi:hypothetical protein
MFRYLSWQAGHDLAGAIIDGNRTPLDTRSGDARGVLPFAVLLLPVAHRGAFRPDIPTCRLMSNLPR